MRQFAGSWSGPLDVLINNAGVSDVPAARTADGLDVQTVTNHSGPFALTNLLLSHITDRVVSVTSQLHRMARLDVADLDWRSRPYRPVQAYNDSKLAQALFSLELQRRLTASGSAVRAVLAHPGIARTTLVDHSRTRVVMWLGPLLDDVEHATLPVLFAATQDVAGNAYVGPDGPGSIKGHPLVRRAGRKGLGAATARQVWAATEELTGVQGTL